MIRYKYNLDKVEEISDRIETLKDDEVFIKKIGELGYDIISFAENLLTKLMTQTTTTKEISENETVVTVTYSPIKELIDVFEEINIINVL